MKDTSSKTKLVYLIALTGVLTIGVLVGLKLSGKDTEDSQISTQTNNSTESANTSAKDVFDKNYFEVGQEMTFATQTIKVTSVKMETTLSTEYSTPWVAPPGTKFIVVEQAVTNTTNNSFVFEECVLFDSKGRKYEASGDAIGKVDNYIAVRDLAPGIPETGVSVYIVPEASTGFEFGALNARTEKLNLTKLQL